MEVQRIKASAFGETPSSATRSRLVFLNCCDGLAATPETINDFVNLFHRMGALGVVGTEIKVKARFAARFAADLFAHLLEGECLAAAFRAARRRMMESMNPLGFAYTPLGLGGLHLHQDTGCRGCSRGLTA